MSEKDLDTVTRRVAALANHLVVPDSSSSSTTDSIIKLSNTAAPAIDSYHRVHGEVSKEPVVWKAVTVDSVPEFTDIIYEKAVGEGIAKVINSKNLLLFKTVSDDAAAS